MPHEALRTILQTIGRSDRQAEVVEYRFFIGLSINETAEVMGLAPRTVERDWEFAQAWLQRYMTTSDQ